MKYYVSVVIIAYNTKKYIKDCLKSVFSQDFQNYEVVIVDNASTDGTTDIINGYIKNRSNVRFIRNEENYGGAIAGNIGIKKAQGEYVFLMDSDDVMPSGTLHALYSYAEKDNSDIVMGRAKSIINGNRIRNLRFKFYSIPSSFVGTYDNYQQCKEIMIAPFYWGKLYKTEFLKDNNIYMPENALYADLYFSTKAVINAKKITVCDCLTYLWRRFEQNDDHKSITSSAAQIDNFLARITSYYDLEELFNDEADLQWIRMSNLIRLLIPIKFLKRDKQFADYYLKEMNNYLQKISYSEIADCPYLTAVKKLQCYLIKAERFAEAIEYSDISLKTYNQGKYTLLCDDTLFHDIPKEYLCQMQHAPNACKLVDVKRTSDFYHYTFSIDAAEENEFICLRAILIGIKGSEKYVSKIEKTSTGFTFSVPRNNLRNFIIKRTYRVAIELLYNQNFCSMWLVDNKNNSRVLK